MLRINEEPLHFLNKPELAEAFSRQDIQEFVSCILKDISSNYGSLKNLLEKDGYIRYLETIKNQLQNSFELTKNSKETKEDKNTVIFQQIKRSFDKKIFSIGDQVYHSDYIDSDVNKKKLGTIGRIYIKLTEPDFLHIGINPEKNTVTWRELRDLK